MPLGRHTWFPIATSARSSSGCDVGRWAIGDTLGLLGFDMVWRLSWPWHTPKCVCKILQICFLVTKPFFLGVANLGFSYLAVFDWGSWTSYWLTARSCWTSDASDMLHSFFINNTNQRWKKALCLKKDPMYCHYFIFDPAPFFNDTWHPTKTRATNQHNRGPRRIATRFWGVACCFTQQMLSMCSWVDWICSEDRLNITHHRN